MMSGAVSLAERRVPDSVVRAGMRQLIRQRLRTERVRSDAARAHWLDEWSAGPVALVPDVANDQHYEVPADFFRIVLGPHLKYSSGLWSDGVADLETSEADMLRLTAERAGIADGMHVLDLGCGWGSLSLWMARQHDVQVTAVSNSASQGAFIAARAAEFGIVDRVHHVVADINEFDADRRFDRVVSVEMMEHVRNHAELLRRIHRWVEADGAVFVHVFAHRHFFWPFEDNGPADWMTRTFFSGGVMPSPSLIPDAARQFEEVERRWISGTHYQATLEAWLERIDANRGAVAGVLRPVYGEATELWVQRWRMFMMACAELFGYDGGREWGVSHHLLAPTN